MRLGPATAPCLSDTSTVAIDEELLTAVRDARRRLAHVGPDRVRAAGDFERVSLPNEDCDALRDTLLAEGARAVVEIGLAYGSSALAIEEALASQEQPTSHLIIDAYQHQFQNAGWEVIANAGLSRFCTLLTERSQLALPRLLANGFVADAAFVDGSHVFHNVFVDLYFLREVVRPDGLIVLDDCHWPSVATAVRYFEVNTGWRLQALGRPTRLRAYRLPSSRADPNFESFKPFGSDSTL